MTPSKFLLLVSFGILAGVAFGSIVGFFWPLIFILFIILVLSFLLGGVKNNFYLLGAAIFLTFFILGLFRFVFYLPADALEKERTIFDQARQFLVAESSQIIGGPEQAMFSAMVLGEKSDLSAETKEIFNRTGTRHILAISGMHLTIVAGLLFEVLIFAGLWRRQAFWLALAGVVLFVLLVGSPPSAVRAGIMAGLYLLARQTGRLSQSLRLLLVAAVVMLLFNPQLLVFSVGFQLSFLAVAGIIFFKPFFDRLLSFLGYSPLKDLLSLSLAAQLTTWPVMAFNFDQVSLVGPIANLLAVPLLPLIMILGLSFVVLGWWGIILGKIFLWPAWLLLHFIFEFNKILSAFKFAAVETASFSLVIIVFYYALLILFYWWLKKYKANVFSL